MPAPVRLPRGWPRREGGERDARTARGGEAEGGGRRGLAAAPLDLEEEEEKGRGVLQRLCGHVGRKGGEEGEGWWGPQGQNRLFTWQLTVHGWQTQWSVV